MEAPVRFQDQPHNRGRGKIGEDDAVRWLEGQGYRVVERNVVNHGGEIDVVARDGDTVCFVEIKARAGKRKVEVEAVGHPAKTQEVLVKDGETSALDVVVDLR